MYSFIPAFAFIALASMACETQAQRVYAATHFALDLEGQMVGTLRSVAGGSVSAEVKEMAQVGQQTEKHLGQIHYEPFQIQFGLGLSDPGLYDWVASAWNKTTVAKNGAIVVADYQMNNLFRREFYNAVITETTVPACDRTSRESGYLAVRFKPEYSRQIKAYGRSNRNSAITAQKAWLPSQFRLTLDGLDCTRIMRIESFTVRHVLPEGEPGQIRDYVRESGNIDFPNLKITFSNSTTQTWQDWFDAFVLQGKAGPQDEKKGRLEFLSQDSREVLATVEFSGLGIFRLETDALQAQSDRVLTTTAELYCEGMKFIPGYAVAKE